MTDSMNFGPDWIRNLSSEGTTSGGTATGARYQLADYRYGREEMLALFDKNVKPPASLTNFKSLCSETTLPPLALLPSNEEEANRGWPTRPTSLTGPPRGRGGSLERGGRIPRGRGSYQSYSRPGYESGWGNGEQPDWSPRKEYGGGRTASMDNWRRARNNEEDEGWRNMNAGRGTHEKWGRSVSWRGEGESEERNGPPERGGRANWHELNRSGPPATRRSWDSEDHLPEWAIESPSESGGTFDEKGAFHGSDDEQLDGRESKPPKHEGLQKSTSQQHITSKSPHHPLTTSKSTMSLVQSEGYVKNKEDSKDEIVNEKLEERSVELERDHKISDHDTSQLEKKHFPDDNEKSKLEEPQKIDEHEKHVISNGPIPYQRNEVNDFERQQEDFVMKLMVEEETPKQSTNSNSYEMSNLQPPPNLSAPQQHRWFYQDPQGQMQGPFTSSEMAEWFKAGYFTHRLKVRRQCDERFFLLGELNSMCGGANPFQTTIQFPILRNDVTKMPDPEMFQFLPQMAAYKQAQARILAEPWSALTLQQQEMAAQRLIMQQQQQQVPQEHAFLQAQTNPLMHMISQMQQANSLPGQSLADKNQSMSNNIESHLQHMQHMGNFLSLQNRLPSALPSGHVPSGMHGNIPGPTVPPESLSTGLPNLQTGGLGAAQIPGMQAGLNAGLGLNLQRPEQQMNSANNNDPISSLLKQLHQQKQQSQQVDALWQQNQFGVHTSTAPSQWQPQVQPDMWDLRSQQKISSPPTTTTQPPVEPTLQQHQMTENNSDKMVEKELEVQRLKEEAKELKKKKELEEKQQKKEAEDKRKQEQKRLEAEKKAELEKKRKEEERIKRELEKARKEAEEKRLKELEEKRRLKEQRKAEEEAKRLSEERRILEEERIRMEKEQQEAEERQRAEERRQEQIANAKIAPWSQSNSSLGLSLTEIQKAEREKRAHEAAVLVQKAQFEKELQQQQQLQQVQEKPTGITLSWAKKPVEVKNVKSLAEIQAEEQERLTKETVEARLKKEKDARETPQVQIATSIWSSQNLTWGGSSSSNWPNNSTISGGFWEETTLQKQQSNKPSTVTKSNSTNTINSSSSGTRQHQQASNQQKSQQQPSKNKSKKEDKEKNHNNNNGPLVDDFANWCYKTLANISTNVDVPTFISFLRDIESAYDVREYCKEYLGESNATNQFANNFLEKRRSCKPKYNAHKDDMCSPAPAITPYLQHSTEFQEVKGKNKKTKKSKMTKVDARILGFNVTSAPDRINVGDRDYGDNS